MFAPIGGARNGLARGWFKVGKQFHVERSVPIFYRVTTSFGYPQMLTNLQIVRIGSARNACDTHRSI